MPLHFHNWQFYHFGRKATESICTRLLLKFFGLFKTKMYFLKCPRCCINQGQKSELLSGFLRSFTRKSLQPLTLLHKRKVTDPQSKKKWKKGQKGPRTYFAQNIPKWNIFRENEVAWQFANINKSFSRQTTTIIQHAIFAKNFKVKVWYFSASVCHTISTIMKSESVNVWSDKWSFELSPLLLQLLGIYLVFFLEAIMRDYIILRFPFTLEQTFIRHCH